MKKPAAILIFFMAALVATGQVHPSWMEYGQLMLANGELEKAEQAFQKLADDQSRQAMPWFYLGKIEFIRQNHDQALKYFRKSIHFQKDFPESWWYTSIILREKEKTNAALRKAQKGLKYTPDDHELILFAAALLAEKEKLNEAEQLAHLAIKSDPLDIRGHLQLARIYQALNRPEDLLSTLLLAQPLNEQDESMKLEGWGLWRSGLYSEAVGVWTTYLEKHTDDEQVKIWYADALYQAGYKKQATDILDKWEQAHLTPDYYLILAREQGDDSDQKPQLLTKGLDLDKRNPDLWYEMAKWHYYRNDFPNAEKALRKANKFAAGEPYLELLESLKTKPEEPLLFPW